MFVKIDHISLSSSDFKKDIEFWKKKGYKLEFIEGGIENAEIKRDLLNGCGKLHDLALLTSGKNVSIELMNHGYIMVNNSFIVPGNGGIESISSLTYDLKKSTIFFKAFGFLPVEGSGASHVLRFNFLTTGAVLIINLKESQGASKKYYLNDLGFTCIAFVSNSAARDRDYIEQSGYEVTDIETVVVNKRNFDIFFVIGPSGEIVEVIEIKQNDR